MAFRPAEIDFEPERWCAGLPSLGVRPMTSAEREAVVTIARRQLGAWWTTLAIIVAIASLPFLLDSYHAPDIGPWAAVMVSFVAVLGFFASIGALALRMRDLWRARAQFLADLANGTVIDFGGTVSRTVPSDADQVTLVRAGVLTLDRAEDQRIAVLPVTQRVLHLDARRGWRALRVRVRAAAAAPSYGMRAPVPREIAYATDPSQELVRRSLSATERNEIHHYIRQVWRPRVLLLIPYFAICVMWLLNWIRSREHSPLGLIAPLVLIAMMARNGRRVAIALHHAALLSRDLATGWVFTIQPRPEPEIGDVAPPSAMRHEFLPHSRTPWTHNGRPASWRNLVH